MKSDVNLIRQLLLLVEDQGDDMNSWIRDVVLEGYDEAQINHHVCLLNDGGFITAIDLGTYDGACRRPRCITWKGQEFLGAIRDKDVWAKTLEIAKAGGAGTLSAILDIAKAVVKKKFEGLLAASV